MFSLPGERSERTLFPLKSASHLPHSNIFAFDHDYLLVDAGDDDAIIAARAHRDVRAGAGAAYPSASRRSAQAFDARP